MSDTLAALRFDFEDLRARWKNDEPWLQARVADAYRAWFRQAVSEQVPPDALRRYSLVESERFFARVIPGPDGHSYWNGGSRFRRNDGKVRNPRTWWWEHQHGPITDRAVVKAACGERNCITVEHQRLAAWSEIKQRFTDEQCIGALQVAAIRLGRTPTRDEYDAMRSRPSGSGLALRYGTWNAAVKAAGLPQLKTGYEVQWTPADCVKALRAFVVQRGFVPSGKYWEREKIVPSHSTITRRFKGWTDFLRAAGLDK